MTITLKPEAEQRLRLKTVPIERRIVPAARLFSGEIVRPLGADGGGAAPVVGGTLEEVLRLADLQAAADGRVRQAQVQIDAAKIALTRAEKVLGAEAGSVRSVDEAKTALAIADAAMVTAKAQRGLLGSEMNQTEGVRRSWVRAAIYSGEAAILDAKADATIRPLASTAPGKTAKRVMGPQTANAAISTVDWYYELADADNFRPGERIAVEIPTAESKVEGLVVPFSAVVHDIHGGQWVYENIAPHTYARRRVQVARILGSDAMLGSGPAAGRNVVTDGAAELFGTEFMTGK